jgi:HK97 family phage major capsid protein
LVEKYGVERHAWSAAEVISTKAALVSTSGTAGGYVVPQAMASTILAPFRQRSIFRSQGALQLTTRTRSLFVPMPDVTTARAAGVPPWAGGLSFAWTAESKTRTEAEPALKQLELVKNELSGFIVLSRPLFDDGAGGALQEVLTGLIGQAVAWLEEYAFFQGNGVGQPQGVVGAPASIAVGRQTANEITFQDVSGMLAKLPPASLGNAVWAFSPTAQTNLLQLSDGANRAIFLSAGASPAGERPQWSLAGLPAIPTDALPALGTKGDLVLMDPSYYAILDHGDASGGTLEIIASEHVNFLTNQITLRVVRRTDGQPLLDKPITTGDGSSLVSPFVVLN